MISELGWWIPAQGKEKTQIYCLIHVTLKRKLKILRSAIGMHFTEGQEFRLKS